MNTITSAVTPYLEKAMSSLASLGLMPAAQTNAPVLALIERVAPIDQAAATQIAHTLQQESVFNEAVRTQLGGMQIANRFAEVTDLFTSVREDLVSMTKWMEDGRLDMGERLKLNWMKVRRGSIPERFETIKKTYLAVAHDANEQNARESIILQSYQDFRMALKEAEIAAQTLLAKASERLQGASNALAAAQETVTVAPEGTERSRAELSRDEAIRARNEEDARYQLAKDLADNLKVSYNTSEVVFARLQQMTSVKERVYQQGTTFFATNEIVLTGLAAAFTSQQGLGEATNTLEAMKEGINKGLEASAISGAAQLEAGLRAGYGATISASSVAALANAVEEFQRSSQSLIAQLRDEASQNATDLEQAVEGSKKRYAALVTGARA